MNYSQKIKIANREARQALIGLGAVIVVWLICGFGLSVFDVFVFGVPLWAFCGILGTFVCGIIVALVLSRKSTHFEFDDDAEYANSSTSRDVKDAK
ncbi:MAG: DUF997 family protein [Coriobacteriales bacterium]|nr:DUF997 family protein [Coriobacteriales bacterium]